MLGYWFMQTAERENNQVSVCALYSIILVSTISMAALCCFAFFGILQPDSTQTSATILTRTKSHKLITT